MGKVLGVRFQALASRSRATGRRGYFARGASTGGPSSYNGKRRTHFGIRRLPCAPLVRILPYMFEKNWKEA